jgi:hypothetical protein
MLAVEESFEYYLSLLKISMSSCSLKINQPSDFRSQLEISLAIRRQVINEYLQDTRSSARSCNSYMKYTRTKSHRSITSKLLKLKHNYYSNKKTSANNELTNYNLQQILDDENTLIIEYQHEIK